MNKNKLIYIDDKHVSDGVFTYVLIRKEYNGHILVTSANVGRNIKHIYFCADTLQLDPAWFMLKTDIWNSITPDFFEIEHHEFHRGILSIQACQNRCEKYLGRPLSLDDFQRDHILNSAIFFVKENL